MTFIILTSLILGQRAHLIQFASIPTEKVVGFRAAALTLGGNDQYQALEIGQFKYDASIVAPMNNLSYFPFTMNTAVPFPCQNPKRNCPSISTNLVEVPMNQIYLNGTKSGARVEDCPKNDTGDYYEVLNRDFLKVFHSNKAPMGIHLTLDELKANVNLQVALKLFFEYIKNVDGNVNFVTVNQVVEWMKNQEIEISQCAKLPEKVPCEPKVCTLPSRSYKLPKKFTFRICNAECPMFFPWNDDWNEITLTKFLNDIDGINF